MQNYKIVFTAKNKVELQQCEMPQPAPGEMLVQTTLTQISIGTELTYLQGNVEAGSSWEKDIIFPREPGYNNIGRIIAVGEGVSPELIGRRIQSGKTHVRFFTMNASDTEQYCFVPDEVEDKEAVFATMGCIVLASIRMAQVRPGDVCVVYGAGVIGQMAARLALVAGAGKVFVTDMSDLRLEKLPKLPGMIPVNTSRENLHDVIRANNGGRLADIVFETTSVGALAQQQVECLERFGKLVITSSPKGRSTIDLDYCNRRCITIVGVHNVTYHTKVETHANRWTRHRDAELVIELLRQKRISTAEMVTHEESFKNAVAMYDMLMEERTRALGVNLIWEENEV